MDKIHNPEKVATSIKEIIKNRYGSLTEYAYQKNITPTQLYNLLNGKDYMTLFSAARFNKDLYLSIDYCTKGILPVFTPEYDYKVLKKAAEVFFHAVKEEDDFRDEYKKKKENLTEEESFQLNAILNKLRIDKAKAAYVLADLLNMDNIEEKQDKKIQKPIKSDNSMTLHEAIESVLRNHDYPLTFTEIANLINEQSLYFRKDGKPVQAGQISARIRHYPQLFEIIRGATPQRVKLSNH